MSDFNEDKMDWFAEPEKELQKEELFFEALSKVVRRPVKYFKPTDNIVFQRCSSCGGEKSGHQSRENHDCSVEHIDRLISSREFNSAVNYLNQYFNKYLTIKCILYDTTNKNVLLYNLHCVRKEHIRRKEEFMKLPNLTASKNVVQSWKKMT